MEFHAARRRKLCPTGERLKPWLVEQAAPSVVISHGGVARVLMAMIGGLPDERAPLADIWQGRVLVFSPGRFDWI